jgi:hypothetical protein
MKKGLIAADVSQPAASAAVTAFGEAVIMPMGHCKIMSKTDGRNQDAFQFVVTQARPSPWR